MRRMLMLLLLTLAAPATLAVGGESVPYEFEPDLGNKGSLQRGAKLFINYCSGCHSLNYLRYQSLSDDLGIPPEVVENNLMFAGAEIGDHIGMGLPERSADWFGKAPPDLSLTARSRGPSWIYSFLRSFYLDDERPTGVNNLVLENTAMPHVLAPLQGYQRLPDGGDHGGGKPSFELVQEGQLSPDEYQTSVADISNFLTYAGEPAKLVRVGLGIKVILFLLVFTVLAWYLKREFWRDVH